MVRVEVGAIKLTKAHAPIKNHHAPIKNHLQPAAVIV